MQYAKLVSLGLLGLALVGCAEVPPPEDDKFISESQLRSADRCVAAQAATGARDDAMLSPMHFDGAVLNSLGCSKLHLIAEARSVDAPLVVYLNLPEDDSHLNARRDAVEKYLRDTGMDATALDVRTGPNPIAQIAAQDVIRRMEKTESGAAGRTQSAGQSPGQSSNGIGASQSFSSGR